jgi:hypothetical protein
VDCARLEECRRRLGRHVDPSGGLAAYAAALLAQFHWLGWPGAAVLALLALTAAALMRALLRRLGASWTWPALVPVPPARAPTAPAELPWTPGRQQPHE